MNSFSAKAHLVCVNLEILRKLCKKMRCFLGKFTRLAQILHDRRSWRSQQISTLHVIYYLLFIYYYYIFNIYYICGVLRNSLMVTWTVGEKLRLNPTKSSISEDILTSVEKVVHGRGQSGGLNPKYKFSKVAGNKGYCITVWRGLTPIYSSADISP